jgi:hypothetical protein
MLSGFANNRREKTRIWAILAFDRLLTRTYNPRPRCFAAVAEKRCLPLNLDVKIVDNDAV